MRKTRRGGRLGEEDDIGKIKEIERREMEGKREEEGIREEG